MKISEMLLFIKFHWDSLKKKGPLNEMNALQNLLELKKKSPEFHKINRWTVYSVSSNELGYSILDVT